MKFVLDTSFLIRSLELGFSPRELIEKFYAIDSLYTTKDVVKELDKIKKPLFKVARKILDIDGVEILDIELNSADNSCLEATKQMNAVLCTEDVRLRKRARNEGLKVGYIRKGKFIVD